MGYYTYFQLRMWDAEGKELSEELYDKVITKLCEVFCADGDNPRDALDDLKEMIDYGCEMKWYECHEDMAKVAKAFPEIKFEFEGRGEDTEDWWIEQFYDGKSAIEYAKPPERKLF